MSIWLLWLLIVVIPNMAIACGLILLAGIVVLVMAGFVTDFEFDELGPKSVKVWCITMGLAFVLGIFLPSKEQMMYIVGGYFVTNVEDIEKLPPNLVKSANRFLEDYAGEEK